MVSAQLKIREVMDMGRRRWKLIVIPTLLVTILSAVGAFLLPRKFESSTTILVRPDQTLAKVTGYEKMAAFEEQLRNLEAIVFSRSFIQALADTLGLGLNLHTEAERQALWDKLKAQVQISRIGMDSFRIVFSDSDPTAAKRGAEIVSDLFIRTRTAMENRQNSLTVQILEKQVEEYRMAFDNSTRSLVSVMRRDLDEQPIEARSLYGRVDELEKQIATAEASMTQYRDALTAAREGSLAIRKTQGALRTDAGRLPILQLERQELPYVVELRDLFSKYEEAARRYTPQYPDVLKLEDEIASLLDRMKVAIESELNQTQKKRFELEKSRSQVIEELKKTSISSRVNQDKESNYESSLKLYLDLKFKLDQAKVAEAVGSEGANQFIILDPAYLPTRPTKPNRTMITAGGLAAGLLLGILSAVVVELLDTTIRSPRQVEIYQKPIIALLPDADQSR
jgi:polysaccharide biosynthesis transport protein